MRIKSVIFSPLEGESVAAGKITVIGVAFNDGAVAIEAVTVSVDGGQSWLSARLVVPESPYSWYHWQADVELAAGKQSIIARAIDALGRSQPLDGAVQWNPAGYGYSAADRVHVEAS